MAALQWDQTSEKFYETGCKNGVLYPRNSAGIYPLGVAWNGLISVSENASGGEPTPQYADDQKYLNLLSVEEFEATIEAFTYPDEFAECDGSAELTTGVHIGQQSRSVFGMAYKTVLGNDVDENDYGYKLHLVYGALASPSEKAYETINDTPEAITFSWDVTTTPVAVTGHSKPTASIVIDSTKVDAAKLATLETVLFGTTGVDPRLPLPDEVKTIIEATPDAIALSTADPADGDTDEAIDSDIVLTFNNAIVQENVLVTDVDGNVIATTSAWDSTAKILTLSHAVDFLNSTEYIVIVNGVVDIYGQLLTTTAVNFTTVA